jgi:hypothetical protein
MQRKVWQVQPKDVCACAAVNAHGGTNDMVLMNVLDNNNYVDVFFQDALHA